MTIIGLRRKGNTRHALANQKWFGNVILKFETKIDKLFDHILQFLFFKLRYFLVSYKITVMFFKQYVVVNNIYQFVSYTMANNVASTNFIVIGH